MERIPVLTSDGSPTLYHEGAGEHYHSLSGAHLEARQRYVWPCRIVETALLRGRVKILDIGFGLGTNLAWAVHEVQRGAPGATIEIVSLERDLLSLSSLAPHLEALPEARLSVMLRGLVTHLRWRQSGVDLALLVGDAIREILNVEAGFDAVFLDPFSPKRNPEPWKVPFLASVRSLMAEGGILSTYSSARSVRCALLRSGWQIGLGPAVGTKSSGTVASAGSVMPPLPPLDEKVRRKLEQRIACVEEEETE